MLRAPCWRRTLLRRRHLLLTAYILTCHMPLTAQGAQGAVTYDLLRTIIHTYLLHATCIHLYNQLHTLKAPGWDVPFWGPHRAELSLPKAAAEVRLRLVWLLTMHCFTPHCLLTTRYLTTLPRTTSSRNLLSYLLPYYLTTLLPYYLTTLPRTTSSRKLLSYLLLCHLLSTPRCASASSRARHPSRPASVAYSPPPT